MPSRTVLIFAEETDLHALAVKREVEITFQEACYIVDSAAYPSKLLLENHIADGIGETSIKLIQSGCERILEDRDICGVWRRRIRGQEIYSELNNESDRDVSRRNSKLGIEGFLLHAAQIGCNVCNNPVTETAGLNKTYQLVCARKLRISVPETLITNNPNTAREFYERMKSQNKGVIYKAFSPPPKGIIMTKILAESDINRLEDLRYCPVIFQEFVEGRSLRVTVVGKSLFAAEVLRSLAGSESDWRIELYNKVIPFSLGEKDEKAILSLMMKLGLTYAALDFQLRTDGELVFLEANPWGQYLFVEIQTGASISREVARILLEGA